jgi:hypothetical protein
MTEATMISFRRGGRTFFFNKFDHDKELEIEFDGDEENASYWLSPNEVNDLVTHLVNQLKSIGEPVDVFVKAAK